MLSAPRITETNKMSSMMQTEHKPLTVVTRRDHFYPGLLDVSATTVTHLAGFDLNGRSSNQFSGSYRETPISVRSGPPPGGGHPPPRGGGGGAALYKRLKSILGLCRGVFLAGEND
jgi:hypothetical protein